jgi:hypothetical protein
MTDRSVIKDELDAEVKLPDPGRQFPTSFSPARARFSQAGITPPRGRSAGRHRRSIAAVSVRPALFADGAVRGVELGYTIDSMPPGISRQPHLKHAR